MTKAVNDVLTVWTDRGYITAEPSSADTAKYTSYINQAKNAICGYCNLPMTLQGLPDGLLYPWAEISYAIMQGGVFSQISGAVSGAIKSVQEGDTTVTFVGNTSANGTVVPRPVVDYSAALDRFRCLF